MDKEEFLKRYDEGERDFSGIELRDVDLSGKGFSKIILRKAKLINVNLSNSYLSKADKKFQKKANEGVFKPRLVRC